MLGGAWSIERKEIRCVAEVCNARWNAFICKNLEFYETILRQKCV